MDKIISYTDDIKKYLSGTQYSGKNIQTTDGKLAYITNTGIAKPYNSVDSLSNTNGCTNELQQIGSSWGDMGIPIGSLMVDGQSCGNETKYVQSMPPNNNFDWEYYSNANPDLQLTTEQQAYDHWTSKGIYQGLLPNSSILSNMPNVGKLGYVDINTTIHPVSKNDYAYTGKYQLFDSNNVTGASMQDCTIPPPTIKYGDSIYIKYNDQYGSINQQSMLEIGASKTGLFISTTDSSLYNTPLKYGDIIIIVSASMAAYINTSTSELSFGPIDTNSFQTFIISVAPGTNYKNNTEIKYGDPFSLIALNPINWSQQAGIDYVSNDIGHSIKPLAECQASCSSTPNCVGIVTDDSNQNNCWLKSRFASANANGNRNTYMLDDAANASVVTTSYDWNEVGNRDYSGNDINSTIKSLDDCKASCETTSGCVGIVTDGSGKNNCWLKNKFGDGKRNTNRNSYMMTKSTVQLPPFKKSVMEESLFGYVNNNNIVFGTVQESSEKNIFTFESVVLPPYVAQCDLTALQSSCDKDSNCSGIIHSVTDNTWQKITNNSSADMYKITTTSPNLYVKNISVKNSKPSFIDSDMFANYPYDNNFASSSKQSVILDNSDLLKKKQQYNQGNQMAAYQGEQMRQTIPKIPPYIEQTQQMYKQLNTKTNEYQHVLKTIKKEKKKYNGTYTQQKEDLDVLQESNKIHVMLWGLSSIVVISMVVMLKNKQ
jgi:hypothetical protein